LDPVVINGFQTTKIDVSGDVTIAASVGGSGPPVLLLHGYPQHRYMWRHVAPELAERYTVVAPDLRGYGESDAPPAGADGAGYSKRAMAADQVAVMRALGHQRFAVIGHDRGARVTHRMCLDHPDAVVAAAVLDIVPTLRLFDDTDQAFATAYYHWFFLIQAPDLPERMIGADPEYFLRTTLDRWSAPGFTYDEETLARYVAAFDTDTIRASCDDYRAAAAIDLEHDRADIDARIGCPLLVMWGRTGAMHRLYDVAATWRERATDVRHVVADCGHFLPEEAPRETLAALTTFLEESATW
jgi:haloacetate dehalogenase